MDETGGVFVISVAVSFIDKAFATNNNNNNGNSNKRNHCRFVYELYELHDWKKSCRAMELCNYYIS